MKTTLLRSAILLAGASFLVLTPLRGQVTQPLPPPTPTASPLAPTAVAAPSATDRVRFEEAIEHQRLDMKIDGSPLTEVVKKLELSFPDVNFVLNPHLLASNPSVMLRLRAAGLRDILEAINIATDGLVVSEVRSPTLVALRLRVEPVPAVPRAGSQDPFRAGPAPTPQPEPVRSAQRFGGAFGLMTPEQPAAAPKPEPLPVSYQVMNLRDILRVSDPKRIKETLDTAQNITAKTLFTLAGDSSELQDRLQLKSFDYHEGSGVLVIIGQPEAIKVAMEVIRSLRSQEPPRLQEPPVLDQTPPAEKPSESK